MLSEGRPRPKSKHPYRREDLTRRPATVHRALCTAVATGRYNSRSKLKQQQLLGPALSSLLLLRTAFVPHA